LCLICHREDYIAQAYEELVNTIERDPKFAKRVRESVQRVLASKKRAAKILRMSAPPSASTVEKLSRQLWEFGEQVRLDALDLAENPRPRRT
jgi:hypothetical protein